MADGCSHIQRFEVRPMQKKSEGTDGFNPSVPVSILRLSHHLHILVHRRPTQPAHPRQLRHIHFALHEDGVVL